jgi:hypothetical protein
MNQETVDREVERLRVRLPKVLQYQAAEMIAKRYERQSHPRYRTGGTLPPPPEPRKGLGYFMFCGSHGFGYGR